MSGPDTIVEILTGYLDDRLDASGPVAIENLERIAVGWSHETWLFDARWRSAEGERVQGLCLRRDPGNALLRAESDLGEQFRRIERVPLDVHLLEHRRVKFVQDPQRLRREIGTRMDLPAPVECGWHPPELGLGRDTVS